MKYKFKNKIWVWGGGDKGSWHFFTIPPEASRDISEKFSGLKRGWGSLPVVATAKSEVGDMVQFETSIFPDVKSQASLVYLLPLKKSLRKQLGIQEGDILKVEIEVKK
jgi:hypothetical protein